MTYQNPTPVAIHIQTVHHKGKWGVVLIKRADNGGWAFPGGYIEYPLDASIEEAAAREFKEETGIATIPGDLFWSTIVDDKLLIFTRSPYAINSNNIKNTRLSPEVTDIRVAYEWEKLCFDSHSKAFGLWLEYYWS